jgi:hypothetical protein
MTSAISTRPPPCTASPHEDSLGCTLVPRRAAGLGAALALHEDQGSLTEAIELLRATTPQHQGRQRSRILASLAGALRALGRLTWNPGLLDEALTVLAECADLAAGSTILRQALELMPATATGRPKALSGLAITCTVAALQGVAVDGLGETPAALLDSAVDLERAAIESAEPGHSSTRVWRANLVGALLTRHQVTGDRRDCVEAVAILQSVM